MTKLVLIDAKTQTLSQFEGRESTTIITLEKGEKIDKQFLEDFRVDPEKALAPVEEVPEVLDWKTEYEKLLEYSKKHEKLLINMLAKAVGMKEDCGLDSVQLANEVLIRSCQNTAT